MKRIIIFILICLVFGAAMSIAVAWWATLREWEESEEFSFVQNGWIGGIENTPAHTLIGAIPVEQTEYALERYEITVGSDYLPKISQPAWFSLSTAPASKNAMIRGIGAGWPLTCVVFVQDIADKGFYQEWDLVASGGLAGTNPFKSKEEYNWKWNHLPVQVIPMGLFVDTLIFSAMLAFPVLLARLNLGQRAKHHYRHKRCPYCKYDLSRSPSVLCSECGADPQILPPIVSYKTNVLTGVVTIILLTLLVIFGVLFGAQFPFSRLHYAAYHGDISAVRSELVAGESIDETAVLIEDGSRFQSTYTPLMLACAGSQTETAVYLIDSGADIERTNSNNETALHVAVNSGSFDCLSLLLENGADANAEFSKNYDALFIVAINPDYDPRIIDLLLENGYRFEAKKTFIDVAIYIAVRLENDKFIHRMLDLGAVPGNWALREAVREGRVDLLKLFVIHGADIDNYWDSERNIYLSVRQDNNPKEVIQYLIQHGHKIDAQDDFGGTVLMLLASMGQPDLCRIFLEFGADPNLRNDDGASAIDYAIDDGFGDAKSVVKVLLDAGAELRLKDNQGKDRFYNISTEILKLIKEHVDSESKEKQPDD